MKTFLIIGVDGKEVHLYQTQATNENTARRRFEREVAKQDWTPFDTVVFHEVFLLENTKKGIEKVGLLLLPENGVNF